MSKKGIEERYLVPGHYKLNYVWLELYENVFKEKYKSFALAKWATTPWPENHLEQPPNNGKKCKKVDKSCRKRKTGIPSNLCIICFGDSIWPGKKRP